MQSTNIPVYHRQSMMWNFCTNWHEIQGCRFMEKCQTLLNSSVHVYIDLSIPENHCVTFYSDSCNITLRCMPQGLTDDQLTLIWRWWLGVIRQQAITWINVDQVLWYGITRPHWVNVHGSLLPGRIGIVDYDDVELSNLHRQILHTEQRVGLCKSASIATSCSA